MNYVIVKEHFIADLEKSVNKMISKGYEPIGGITLYEDKFLGEYFTQAMGKK